MTKSNKGRRTRSTGEGPATSDSAHERLKQRIAGLLDGSLGLYIFPRSWISAWRSRTSAVFESNPYFAGLRTGVVYAILFCGIPWIVSLVPHLQIQSPSLPLLYLQIYGSFWCGWATMTTRITSSSILKTIEDHIIPDLSSETADKVYHDLTHRFEKSRLLRVSWTIAILSATIAGFLVYFDVPTAAKPSIGAIVWWSVGWAILFATAAKVVNVSCFYRVFAAHVADDPRKLYAMDPARSTLVISVASVAQSMMLFWLGIALSIALLIPFGVKNWSAIDVSNWSGWLLSNLRTLELASNRFVLVEVPVAGFFSIGVGTIVFLRSEAALRRAVKDITHSTLRLIEQEVADLSSRLDSLDDASWKRLTELHSLHDEVATTGSYRSVIVSGLSVLVPFVPLVSVFIKIWHGT